MWTQIFPETLMLMLFFQGGRIDDQRAFLGPRENGGDGGGRQSDL